MGDTLEIKKTHPVTSLTVFFPCFNEREAIGPLTVKTLAVLKEICPDYEIIIVDDGSKDGTGQLADQLAREYPAVRVIHHPVNLGYGAALQSGFGAAAKEYVFYTDGDGQFDVTELHRLLPLMEQYDIVSAYRLKRQEGWKRQLNAFCWTALINFLFNLNLKDIDCAFKLYKRRIFDQIEMISTGALIDTEILARASRLGFRITQVGVHHYPRIGGRSTGANFKVILHAFRELFKLRKTILQTGKR
ncbi:MAG TPA: glycosyltransferase family 2 protein [Anaerohalosphaeraceae bacterium]|nr:glycosyltransferase family 2 protein [Anaerohalosphaeraceae bacterium]